MKRVMIVDDKDDNLYYLTKLLESDGCVVEAARHGLEALMKARGAPPELVISDLLMPVMDGYTLLRHWKTDAVLSRIPFVVYTATYTAPEDEQLALDLGADAFILKPSEPQDFLARLAALRRNADGPRPAPPRRPVGDDDVHLREYSEVLIRKLEAKSLELEETNRSLQQDIAVRADVEAALRESEEKFRILIESIPQLVWMAGPGGEPSFTNRRWREYTGLEDTATWLRAVHPGDSDALREAWARASTSATELDAELRLVRHDGSARWFLVRGIPMRDASGAITRWLGTCTDIDELKVAQRQLQETEERLRQAQKMEAIGRLAGGVAHDFNNLLSVILTYASLLLEDSPPSAPARADLEEIKRAGQRATDLTRQLLAFSRQQVLQPRVLELGATVRGMEKMLRRIVGEDLTISLIETPPSGRVYVDPSQIEQIVMNLVVNSRDAMPRGGRIAIETTASDVQAGGAIEPGSYVVLRLEDSGIGMTPEVAARVFEPFFTTKDKGKGTGLGLSTVFGIVKQSGGHIALDSRPGVGTTFTIYLPRTERAIEPAQPPLPASERTGTETVLLVEDDDQVRALSVAILRRHGYTVLDAENAGEALLICDKHDGPIHLLLTDVVMPRMSGRELAERLVAQRPELRVLFVSGYSEELIADHGVLVSRLALLQKPITPDGLLHKIREVLDSP